MCTSCSGELLETSNDHDDNGVGVAVDGDGDDKEEKEVAETDAVVVTEATAPPSPKQEVTVAPEPALVTHTLCTLHPNTNTHNPSQVQVEAAKDNDNVIPALVEENMGIGKNEADEDKEVRVVSDDSETVSDLKLELAKEREANQQLRDRIEVTTLRMFCSCMRPFSLEKHTATGATKPTSLPSNKQSNNSSSKTKNPNSKRINTTHTSHMQN